MAADIKPQPVNKKATACLTVISAYNEYIGPLLLTWFNSNPNKDK